MRHTAPDVISGYQPAEGARAMTTYSRDDRVIVGLLVIAAVASTLSAILFVGFSAGLVLGAW